MEINIKENTEKVVNFIGDKLHKGELNDYSLVHIIALCVDYGNIQRISDYGKTFKKSYNGVKNNRNIIEIAKSKFVLDNK